MGKFELLGRIGPMGKMAVIPGSLSGIIATAGGGMCHGCHRERCDCEV